MHPSLQPRPESESQQFVPIELAQIQEKDFMPIELAQIPTVLLATGWSNHQLIMSRSKTDEQRLFYMLYAGHEQLEYKELLRAFKTNAMTAILGAKEVQSTVMQTSYPKAGLLFKDCLATTRNQNCASQSSST